MELSVTICMSRLEPAEAESITSTQPDGDETHAAHRTKATRHRHLNAGDEQPNRPP